MPIRRPSICLQGGGPSEDVCSPRLGATVRPLIAVRNGSARPSKTTRRTRGFEIVAEYYDAAVAGADPVETRPGFAAMLQRIAANGARTIIVETASPATSWCRRLAMRCYANSAYPDCRRQPTLLSRRWTDREAYPPGARCHC